MRFRRLLLVVLSALSLAACGASGQVSESPKEVNESSTNLNRYDKVIYEYFDTVTTFLEYTDNEDEHNKHMEILTADLKKYHELFNTYYDFDGVNNIKTINDKAGIEPVKVDPAIIELIEYGFDMYEKTDGKINIAIGRLLELWHDYREEAIANPDAAKIPTTAELKEAASHSDITKIQVDKENSTVFITDPNIKIDVGAIGKGYGIEKIATSLKEAGVTNGILSVGGDDILIGDNPSKESGNWNIAIQNPDTTDNNPYSSIVGLKSTTVVTSGDYQRFYKVDGKTYHHIIDPVTMMPSDYFRSVSVIHEDIALADTLSTYFFIIDLDTGMQVAKEYGAECLWIDKDGNQYKTPGWDKLEQ